ncbi:helix-turn-helix domain-containing protein [Streptomyces alkaliphilus]|uniref:Helix-turn-helix domain-containing protein n=1 Tax=Streptomyces alkaliphilus TaxID=1472722 RepID=A0A7W3Y084_9ACTN|nr:helix-turn-helix domain-containing protein [Streptomyces alkaliphilus]MBB0242995.1 helix-turn-helix domain-containing protein [Streptomyces alkaliphilus]
MSGFSFDPVALRRIRTDRGVSQKKLGAATGTSRVLISHYENGHYRPSIATLAAIAHALDVPMDDFIKAEVAT